MTDPASGVRASGGSPLLSVIIATRNRAERLKHVIDAALEDPYPNLEVCVADGASTDGTVDLLASYGPRVRFISEPDGGEFIARNRALTLARGTLIRNLSDDDVPVPGGAGAAVTFMQQHPEVDLLFGQCMSYYVHRTGVVELYDARRRTNRSIELRNFMFGYAPQVVSETAVFRRSMLDRIGVFTQMKWGDYDFWLRALSAGCRIAVSDAVMVHHFRFENAESSSPHYRGMLMAGVDLAERFGTRFDRFYARHLWLPYRRLRFDISRAIPATVATVVRRTLWDMRHAGHARPSTPPVRMLRY